MVDQFAESLRANYNFLFLTNLQSKKKVCPNKTSEPITWLLILNGRRNIKLFTI